MATGMLIGAGVGAATSMATGKDPLKGAMMGGAMGGIGGAMGGAGVASGAGANAGSTSMMQTLATPTVTSGATAAVGNTMNPALTNGMGQSSNALTQFGRDASSYMGDVGNKISDFGSNVGDTIGEGFDYMNDKTGMENKDWTQMAMTQGMNSMQPTQQAPITHSVPQIQKQQYEPSQAQVEGMLTSNPRINQELRKRGLL
jgi:hypothetical protein